MQATHRGFTAEEAQHFEDSASRAYRSFVEKAALSRGLSVAAMEEVAICTVLYCIYCTMYVWMFVCTVYASYCILLLLLCLLLKVRLLVICCIMLYCIYTYLGGAGAGVDRPAGTAARPGGSHRRTRQGSAGGTAALTATCLECYY